MTTKLLLTILLVFSFLFSLHAQDDCELTTNGEDFWIAFMERGNSGNKKLSLHLSSQVNTQGSVSIGGVFFQNFTLTAGLVLEIEIPHDANMAINSEVIENLGIQVLADDPISLFAKNRADNSSEASLVFPSKTLRETYFAMCSTPDTPTSSPPGSGEYGITEFIIVASQDNTQIQITPSQETEQGKLANTTFSITLNKAQTYLVQSTNVGELASDLTGSKIVSDKPVALFSGNIHSRLPADGACCQDHIYEQVPPLNTWGKNFVTTPLATRAYDVFRVLASKNNTNIELNGTLVANLNEGEFYEFDTQGNNVAQIITANKTIMMAQFSISQQNDGATGDPFMTMLNPNEQTLSSVFFESFALAAGTNFFFVNTITKTTNTGNITIDGITLPTWTAIAGSDFSYAVKSLTVGQHNINSSDPNEGFIAYAYGFSNNEGYGYATGMSLSSVLNLGDNDIVVCAGEVVNLDAGEFESYLWSTNETTPTISISNDVSGEYWVETIDIFDCIKRDTIQVTFNSPSIDLGANQTICSGNILTLDAGMGFSYLWSDGSSNQTLDVSQTGLYQVQITDNANCVAQDEIEITVLPELLVGLKDSLIIECGELPFVELISLSSAATVFNWDFGDGNTSILENPPLFKYALDGTYTITLEVGNGICTETTSTIVIVTGSPANAAPTLNTTLTFNTASQCYETEIAIGQTLYFELNANDTDLDTLEIEGVGVGFVMTSAEMILNSPRALPIMSASFSWSPTCDLLPNGLESVLYELTFLAKDSKECNRFSKTSDEICVKILLHLPPNPNTPTITSSTLLYDVVEDIYYDSLEINNNFNFNFELQDTDSDSLTVEFSALNGFSMSILSATFTPTSGANGLINAQFDWQILCEHLIPITSASRTEYFFEAIIKDYDLCQNVRSTDTTQIKLILLPNPNAEPILSSSLLFDVPNQIYLDTVIVTQSSNFTFQIDDLDGDSLTFSTQGQGFDMSTLGMTFTPNSGTTTLLTNFSWLAECQDLDNGAEKHYLFDGIITDYDLCGNIRSLTTASFDILVLPPAAGASTISSSSLNFDAVNLFYFDTLQVEEAINFTFDALNSDGDVITLTLEGEGFTLASIGASFQITTNPDNSINGTFDWQTNCNTLNPNTDTTTYIFNAISTDFDVCGGQNTSDTVKIRLTVLPYINATPTVDTLNAPNLIYDAISGLYKVELFFGDTLEFDIFGDDADGNIVTLIGQGLGFDLANLEMEFQPIRDLPSVISHFRWATGCNIKDKVNYAQPYLLDFIISDEGNCAADASDTLHLEITLKEFPNDAPILTTDLTLSTNLNCYETRILVGDTLTFDVLATDLNQDNLTITGSGIRFNFSDVGMDFTSVTGIPASLPLSSEFVWATNFDILEDFQDSITYELQFFVDDGNCETREICVKITLVNCQTPDLAGIPAISNFCAAGDTLGREIPENSNWKYWWTSDVGINKDSTQRLIYVQKVGIYTIHVQHLADHCIYESRTIVQISDLFLAPQDTIICQNEAPINLIARDLAHPSDFIFEWKNLLDTSVIIQNDTTGILEVDSSGIYLVKMTNPNGGCFLIDTVEIKINKNPSFDIVGYNNPTCQEPINLRIENTNITRFKIKWSVQNLDSTGYFEGNTDNLEVKILKSGRFIATITDTATNCETSKFIDILINQNPKINLDASLKDTLICQDGDFLVDAFDASHSIDAIYEWKNLTTNSVVSDSSKLVIEFGNFDKTNYEITVSNSVTNCEAKDTITVAFVRQAVAKIDIDKSEICLGEEFTLIASGGDSYLWNTRDSTESITITPQEIGIHTYILEAKYQNSCASSFDTLQIEVFPIPILDIDSSFITCQEDTTAFLDVRHASHSLNSKYKWYWIGDTTSLSDSSRIDLKFDNFKNKDFDVLKPFDLIVQVTNGQNTCFATDTVNIEFSKSTIAKIDTLFDKEICLGESITLRASGGDSLYWNTGDSTNSIRITPEKVGFERIILFANNNNSCSATSDTVFIKVNPLPLINLHELDSIVICYGDTLMLTPTGGDSGKYVWEHLPSPADTVFISPKSTTTYYVFGTDSNTCQNSDSIKVIVRPTIELPAEMQACAGNFLEIGTKSIVSATYLWSAGGFTTPTIKVKAAGTYSVQVTTAECVYTRSVEVKFIDYPILESTSDTTFCFELGADEGFADGKTHFIQTQISNFDTAANYDYVWLDTAGFVLGAVDSLEISEEGVYIVQVFDKNLETSCLSRDTVKIKALCEPRIFIPTGFSPNDDRLNDRFVIFGKHLQNFKMEVYDRWGVLIYVLERGSFEDIQADEFWDGTVKGEPLPIGQYIWTIQYQNPLDGKAETVNLNGQVNIVR